MNLTYEQVRGHLMTVALGLESDIPVLRFGKGGDPEKGDYPNGYALARVSFGGSRQRGSRAVIQDFEGVGTLTLMVLTPAVAGSAKVDRLREAFEAGLRVAHPEIPLYVRDFHSDDEGYLSELNKNRTDITAVFVRHYSR